MLAQIETAFKARQASEAKLLRSDQKLRQFIADASHELRTPLAAVRAYAELFSRGAASRPDDLARSMSGITREAERMSLLVDDLLLLARLDEGRPLEQTPVELADVVCEAVDAARVVDDQRPIDVDVEPATVIGDRDRLRQLIDNLFANVRAHTPRGRPSPSGCSASDGMAQLSVSDSGPGLTERGGGPGLRALLPSRQLAHPRERRRRARTLDRLGGRRGARRQRPRAADPGWRRDVRGRDPARCEWRRHPIERQPAQLFTARPAE